MKLKVETTRNGLVVETKILTVLSVGTQGPPGPPGSPGPANGVVHQQSTPSSTWIIGHSFGRIPSVQVFNNSHELLFTDITSTASTVTVSFPSPEAGYAVLI